MCKLDCSKVVKATESNARRIIHQWRLTENKYCLLCVFTVSFRISGPQFVVLGHLKLYLHTMLHTINGFFVVILDDWEAVCSIQEKETHGYFKFYSPTRGRIQDNIRNRLLLVSPTKALALSLRCQHTGISMNLSTQTSTSLRFICKFKFIFPPFERGFAPCSLLHLVTLFAAASYWRGVRERLIATIGENCTFQPIRTENKHMPPTPSAGKASAGKSLMVSVIAPYWWRKKGMIFSHRKIITKPIQLLIYTLHDFTHKWQSMQ